jgi:hypothetical protein
MRYTFLCSLTRNRLARFRHSSYFTPTHIAPIAQLDSSPMPRSHVVFFVHSCQHSPSRCHRRLQPHFPNAIPRFRSEFLAVPPLFFFLHPSPAFTSDSLSSLYHPVLNVEEQSCGRDSTNRPIDGPAAAILPYGMASSPVLCLR